MENLRIKGGVPLRGEVETSGAKNAALPALCAALLADGEYIFENVPALRDIRTTKSLLEHLGCEVEFNAPEMQVRTRPAPELDAPYELVKKMRASILVLGPLVARYGEARVSLPGGCAIGTRPIDQHLKGLEALGARVQLDHGYVHVDVPKGRLQGAEFCFDVVSVTGTENLLMAACIAKGRTTLINAAREPEIEDLAKMLSQMGAKIQGAGSDVIVIDGVEELRSTRHSIMPDRIEAGTYMVAAAATRGDVLVRHVPFFILETFILKLRNAGVQVETEGDGVRVVGGELLKSVDIHTSPHPGFPTDMQAQFMTLMSLAEGSSTFNETIFENRFMHVPELNRMGANIEVHGHLASVHGVKNLQGAEVMATDLRASASLVIAGLVAEGMTEIRRIYHLDRGYEHLEKKFAGLGAKVERVSGDL